MQEIWKAVLDADVEQDLAAKRENDRLAKLREEHHSAMSAIQDKLARINRNNSAESLEEVEQKLAAVEHHEADVAEAEAAPEQAQAQSTTYADLCIDIQRLRTDIKDAVRAMKVLANGKEHAEQAFKKWESVHPDVGVKALLLKTEPSIPSA